MNNWNLLEKMFNRYPGGASFISWRRVVKSMAFFLLILLFCLCENDASIHYLTLTHRDLVYVRNPGEHQDIAPHLKSAWQRAAAGDTIVFPAGIFKFEGELLLEAHKKSGIHLMGAGTDKNGTTLYRHSETPLYMIKIHGSSRPISESKIEISGICFQAMKTRLFEGDSGTGYPYFRGIALRASDFYLHDCKFQWFSNRAIEVSHLHSHGKGVIAENEFIDNLALDDSGKWSRGYGISVGVFGEVNEWVPVEPGTNNFVFIEDNYFARQRPAVASGQGALFVFRYNHTELNSSESCTVDMHGGSPSIIRDYPFSARFSEIYDNTFVSTPEGEPLYLPYNYGAIGFRGGESVIHNNIFRGYPDYSIELTIEGAYYKEYYRHPPDYQLPNYPIPYQIGYESGSQYGPDHSGTDPATYGKGDIFIWNNFYDGAESIEVVSPISFKGVEYDYLKEGRDFHYGPRPGYTPYPYPHPRRLVGKKSLSSFTP